MWYDLAWQDVVISLGGYIFLIALIPSILSKDKPARSTSILSGGVLLVFAFTYATLDLWSSMISTSLLSVGWLFLGWQKHRQKN